MTDSIHQEHTTNFSIIIYSIYINTFHVFTFSAFDIQTENISTWKAVVVPSQAILHLNNTKTYFFPQQTLSSFENDDFDDDTITAVVHPEVKWVTLLLLLLFMAFFMAMFGLLGRWRRITLFTMCKRLTGFRAPQP